MPAGLAYLLVIVVGATTPLAIKLGGETFTPVTGLALRIMIAAALGSMLFYPMGVRLNLRRHWRLYLAASIGIFPNLVLVYTAVLYISSGMVVLLFGLQPIISAILMRPILGEPGLDARRMVAILVALAGLVLIVLDSGRLEVGNALGVVLMLGSCLLFSGSALWVKRLNRSLAVPPVEQTLGGMLFSLPGLLLSWWLVFGIEPVEFTPLALASLFYLALVVSLAGFAAYYFILAHMAIETVMLIPLITPVVAIILGAVFLGETVTIRMLAGAALLLAALAIHQQIRLPFPARKPADFPD